MTTTPPSLPTLHPIQKTHDSNPSPIQSKPQEKINKAAIATGLALGFILATSLIAVGAIFSHTALVIIGAAVLSICIISILIVYKNSQRITTIPQQAPTQTSYLQTPPPQPNYTYPDLYLDLLKNNFSPTSITTLQNQRLRVTNTNTPTILWTLKPHTQCALMSTVGDISQPAISVYGIDPYTSMVVNAANKKMLRGGGGTNAALSRTTSVYSWEGSKEGKSHLEEGDVTVGNFLNPDGTSNINNPSGFTYLCQALGPKALDHNNNPDQCFTFTKKAYSTILERARQLNCSAVQLPLLSTGIYAPAENLVTNTGSSIRELWISASKTALLQALSEFNTQHPHYELLVIVVGNQDLPISWANSFSKLFTQE